MQIIDLFSGIGGFSLAGRWMGWRTIQFCEIDSWCHKVLKKHWPDVPIHTDIKTLTPEIIKQNHLYNKNEKTIVTGGVPCQPASTAGKRRGESDERWLWPQTIKFIGEFKPTFAVLENVAGLVSMENGKTLDRILSDLEDEGYTTEQVIIPACGVGAWHRRDRIWIIAYSLHVRDENGLDNGTNTAKTTRGKSRNIKERETLDREWIRNESKSINKITSDTINRGQSGQGTEGRLQIIDSIDTAEHVITNPFCGGQPRQGEYIDAINTKEAEIRQTVKSGDGCPSDQWSFEPAVGRVANGIPNRVDRLKGLGNAIVPQVALELFQAIENTLKNYAQLNNNL